MYAEDIDLLPDKIFTRLMEECLEKPGSGYDKIAETYDLIAGLFREMNNKGITPTGRYKDVDYFNGGLFNEINPVELTKKEVEHLEVACTKNWNHMNPAIFGTILEQGMEKDERHVLGAHYTHEIDIKKIVDPVIVQPWKKKIDAVMDEFTVASKDKTIEDLKVLHKELAEYKVLDPACGSGNFLFIAYKEIKLLEREILKHLKTISSNKDYWYYSINCTYVSTKQFYGIDLNPFAVELAKVTLMIAKEMNIKEAMDKQDTLPLDNLDNNIICADALFTEWPEVEAIIGNPPYQSKRNMQREFGAQYVNDLLKKFKNKVPGRADFCVYWFYKAHNHLKESGYAGLVATNTITQNYSREGSLDYIVDNGGEIFSAVSSTAWSGEAAVTVSIVCWKKGMYKDLKELYVENKDAELVRFVTEKINSSLSLNYDVSDAKTLYSSRNPKKVFQGQVPGLDGYFIDKATGLKLIKANHRNKKVVIPHLIADELIGGRNSQPKRFMIDFTGMDIIKASSYKEPFKILAQKVLPERELYAKNQEQENIGILERDKKSKVNKHHLTFFKQWWQPAYGREDLLNELKNLKRYIACSGVSKRNIFEFVSSEIIPNAAIFAFVFEDDYSFGIIQSNVHWIWWKARCSTFETRLRYTSNTVWDAFPFPQTPTETQIKKVAVAAKTLRDARNKAMKDHVMSLRDLYRLLEQPGKNHIKDLHTALDKAVMEAYGFNEQEDLLAQLLALNLQVAQNEKEGKAVQPPGLPGFIKNKEEYISDDCVRFEWE
jgi:SAM-dependent methyltransferase